MRMYDLLEETAAIMVMAMVEVETVLMSTVWRALGSSLKIGLVRRGCHCNRMGLISERACQ